MDGRWREGGGKVRTDHREIEREERERSREESESDRGRKEMDGWMDGGGVLYGGAGQIPAGV